MHISSLIRSPSWLYCVLWTQNNLFHASFSRQRKPSALFVHAHYCEGSWNWIAKFPPVFLSRSLWLSRTLSWAQSVCAIPVPSSPELGYRWRDRGRFWAGSSTLGWRKNQGSSGHCWGLCCRINAIFCSQELGWVVWLITLVSDWRLHCLSFHTERSCHRQKIVFLLDTPLTYPTCSPREDWVTNWRLSHTGTGVV